MANQVSLSSMGDTLCLYTSFFSTLELRWFTVNESSTSQSRCKLLIIAITIAGCTNDPSSLGLSDSSFKTDYGVVLVDTVTVSVSTVLLDSIPTSNTGVLLVGGYSDMKLGRLQAEAYVQVGIGDTWSPRNGGLASLVCCKFSGYTYVVPQCRTFEVGRETQASNHTVYRNLVYEGQILFCT